MGKIQIRIKCRTGGSGYIHNLKFFVGIGGRQKSQIAGGRHVLHFIAGGGSTDNIDAGGIGRVSDVKFRFTADINR